MTNDKDAQKLNELCKDYFTNLELDLNKNSQPWGEAQPGNVYYKPTIVSLGNYQIIKGVDEVIILDPPIAGIVKDLIIKEEDKMNAILIRRIVGYSAALRVISGQNTPEQLLKYLTKEMIMSLNNSRGFSKDTINMGIYGKFERPKNPGVYFLPIEEYAGYELRLYSDCYSCIELT